MSQALLPKLWVTARFFQLCSWARRYGCKAEDWWEANVSSSTKLTILSHDFIHHHCSNLNSHLVLPLAIFEFVSILSLIYSFIILHKWKRKNNSKGKRSHVFLVTLALLWIVNIVQVQIFWSSCLSIEFREPIELGFHQKILSSNLAHFSEYFHCNVLWIFVCEWYCYIY